MSRALIGGVIVVAILVACIPSATPQVATSADCRVPGEASTGTWTLDVSHDARGFRAVLRSEEDVPRRSVSTFDLATGTFGHEVMKPAPTRPDGAETNESHARAQMTVRGLHEFRDRDGDGRFGPGDESLRKYALRDVEQAQLQVLGPIEGGYNAIAVYPINATAHDAFPVGQTPPLPGQLRISFLLGEEGQMIEGEWVPPTRVPIGVDILGFPFIENDTRIGLEVRFTATGELGRIADGLVHVHELARSEHRWAPCADIDGSTYGNRLLILEEDSGALGEDVLALFGYPAADNVHHAFAASAAWIQAPAPPALPALPPLLGDAVLFLGAAFVALLLVASTAWPRLRNP